MKLYTSVYAMLMRLNFSTLVMYRSNFINDILSSIAWALFNIASIFILTARTPSAFGWKREELILLTAAFNIFVGFFHMIFSKNFQRLPKLANSGDLDRILLYPVDSQFSISLWEINYTSLMRIPIGVIIVFYVLQILRLTISWQQVLTFAFFVVVGLSLQYSIWLLATSLTVRFTRLSNISEVMYSVTGMARYPRELFRQMADYVFVFLLPITLIVVTPVKVLLRQLTLDEAFLFLGLTLCFFYVSRKFWKFSLQYYTSASS